MNGGKKRERKLGERTQRCSSITAIIILVSFSTSRLLPPDVITGASRAATATVMGNKSMRGERKRDLIRLDQS